MSLLKLAWDRRVGNVVSSRAASSSLVVVLPLDPATQNTGSEKPFR